MEGFLPYVKHKTVVGREKIVTRLTPSKRKMERGTELPSYLVSPGTKAPAILTKPPKGDLITGFSPLQRALQR